MEIVTVWGLVKEPLNKQLVIEEPLMIDDLLADLLVLMSGSYHDPPHPLQIKNKN